MAGLSTPDAEVRIGVVGVGQRAVLATHAHGGDSGARVVACADPSAAGKRYATELFGAVALRDDHRALLDAGLDAVMLFTPDHLHAAQALDFLRAGTAVFVEKPLALSTEDCDAVLAAARDSRAKLYVGHNLRHLPMLRAMRALIEDGAIGAVKSVWCRHFVGHGGDFYFRDWHADRRKTRRVVAAEGRP